MDTKKATQVINNLTKDEDLRQDLWVEYLSGTPLSQLYQQAVKLLFTRHIESQDTKAYQLVHIKPSSKILSALSTVEKHVALLLYLGYNVSEISVTLGQNRVAISQLIASIKQNIA